MKVLTLLLIVFMNVGINGIYGNCEIFPDSYPKRSAIESISNIVLPNTIFDPYYLTSLLGSSNNLMLPASANPQWMLGFGGYGYGGVPIVNPIPFQGGYGYGGVPIVNPIPFQGGNGYGGVPIVNPIPFQGGNGYGQNYVREPIKEDELVSKIKGLRGRKAAQISKSGELNGYYECVVISHEEVPPLITKPAYEVDTNDVMNVVSCLLDNNEFVFVSKVEGKSNSFFIVPNDMPYGTSLNTGAYRGWLTPSAGVSYGVSDWLNWATTLAPAYLNPFAYNGVGGILGNINVYAAAQYPSSRIKGNNPLPYLPFVTPESIYGDFSTHLIPGNIAQFGPPPIIPSETTQDISRILLRNGHFNSFYPGSSFPTNPIAPSF